MTAAPTTSSAPTLGRLTDQSFEKIQGNILAGFNMPCQAFLHMSFGNSPDNARRWLTELVGEEIIATTNQVLDYGNEHSPTSDQTWVAVSFTSSGLLILNPELAGDLMNYPAFWDGAIADRTKPNQDPDAAPVHIASPALVGDVAAGDPSDWAVGRPDQAPIDVLLTVAAETDSRLKARAAAEQTRATGHGLTILEVRQGTAPPTQGQFCARLPGGVEHFGFKDGISQPNVRDFPGPVGSQALVAPGEPIAAGEFVLGYDREPDAPPDQAAPPVWMADGSFQVWLRLNQDVPRWRRRMTLLTGSAKDGVDVAAKVIGRRQDGTPLAHDSAGGKAGINDFDYDDDQDGQKTPLFAHIRKMNPRDPRSGARIRRLIRRGMTYGPFLGPDDPDDATERGLVFNAFMAGIENQFEFLQREWASSAQSVSPPGNNGPDPVVGTSDDACLLNRKDTGTVALGFERFVWTTGGVYAFAPSIPTLARLAGQGPHPSEV